MRRSALQRLRQSIAPGSALIILIALLLLPIANPRVYATDEVQYYVYLRSLRFDGDLDFANDYRELARRNPRSGIEGSLLQENRIRPKTGLYGNIAPVGCAIMWAPFFLLADAGVHAANLLGAAIPADGFSKPYILSVCYASALYGLLGLLLCQRLTRRYASPRAATLATIAIWLASPLVFYMFIQMPFAHATGFFLTSLFLTIWHETRPAPAGQGGAAGRRSWRAWAALGAVGGLMTMTREQLGLFLVIPAIEGAACYLGQARGRQWGAAGRLAAGHALFGAVFALALTPQFAAYQVLNGEPRPAGEVSGRINWCSPHFIDTLIDSDPAPSGWCNTVGDFTADFPPFSRGAFVWSPLLAIGLAGLPLLWRRDRTLTLALLAVIVAQTYINGAYGTTWHLRGAFGFRRLIECTPIFILGLALLLDRAERRVGWAPLGVALALFALWNAGLVLNGTFFESETSLRRIGLIWPDTWRWQAELPTKVASRIQEILFDRCRFLQNGSC
jgi:hypothetical protein